MTDPDWYAGDSPAKAAGLAELLDEVGVRPASILDVGCGAGGVLALLAGRYGSVGMGLDPAAEAVALARRHPGLEIHQGRLEQSALTADLVLCIDVFEHVADDRAFLSALRGRGRWYAFRIPLDESLWDRLRGRTEAFRERYGHLHAYTRGRALARLEEAGFETVGERYHRIPVGGRVGRAVRAGLGRVAPHTAARVVGGWSLLVLARDR